jgi:ascorbate-specific PTS system EIIC-type component UlaA
MQYIEQILDQHFTLIVVIILVGFYIPFYFYISSKSREAFKKNDKAFEKQNIAIEGQKQGLQMQAEAVKIMQETNKLLAEILQDLKN